MCRLGVLLLCVVYVPSVYGQGLWKSLGRGRSVAKIERSVTAQVRANTASSVVHVPVTPHPSVVPGKGMSEGARTPSVTHSTVVLQQQAIQAPRLQGNTVSRKAQQEAARVVRPYLFQHIWQEKLDDVRLNGIPPVNALLGGMADHTLMQRAYVVALEHMQELSGYIDSVIYYQGTSESTQLPSEQIRRTLQDIVQTEQLVEAAREYFPLEPVLKEAAVYLQHVRRYYMFLGTAIYMPLTPDPLTRTDGHTFVLEEFGLMFTESPMQKIPEKSWWNPKTWQTPEIDVFPKQWRVAIIQDDIDVVTDFIRMTEKAGLSGWQIDTYEDPEYFLNRVNYRQYDMVLTDIMISNGGGGYLTWKMRKNGYRGTVLSLSGYAAEDQARTAQLFFDAGMDGMIPLTVRNNRSTLQWEERNRPDMFWSRLYNYFLLKEKHGWKH